MSSYSKALPILMKAPVTDDIIRFLTNATLKVLPASNYPSPPSSPNDEYQPRLPSLMTFITNLVRYTNVYTPTLLTTVCYLNKLKRLLPKDATGLPSTIHRIFLACLILSAKFHNDSSPLNKHWVKYTDGLFTLEDVNLMERQLLQLLDWDLRVSEDDLLIDLEMLLEPIREDLERSRRRRILSNTNNNKKRLPSFNDGYISPISSRPTSPNSYQQPNQKFYNLQRNVSVASNLSSSSTLIGSMNDLKRFTNVRTNSNTQLEKLNSMNDSQKRQSWDLEQVMNQYGF
ncbi:Pcl1p NDAI_0A06050 [Naumovozyma dairenensis CBS 421]|uniref:Cyclin-like domain-containing protein n=1 Tax=Naumovozyma dairenensis (strain ATCC 10597 / BCRC 20456 / CBS 421 / NBRC 0211 / NRRL Y-12639) TaxID=1071378 RepID=G0W4M2_NAUDC|nr:hypothetical protein NDAI_0A06050 [Naumovozyma dairenensis CBS 421]CCD22760.1 hypothetical protein NDAI_0A06050 [Naumovozyma dairenensis CBS 421]